MNLFMACVSELVLETKEVCRFYLNSVHKIEILNLLITNI